METSKNTLSNSEVLAMCLVRNPLVWHIYFQKSVAQLQWVTQRPHKQIKWKSESDFAMCLLSSRGSEQVECVILQEGDLCVGRDHGDSALPLWLPIWYWSSFVFVTAAAVWSFNTQ